MIARIRKTLYHTRRHLTCSSMRLAADHAQQGRHGVGAGARHEQDLSERVSGRAWPFGFTTRCEIGRVGGWCCNVRRPSNSTRLFCLERNYLETRMSFRELPRRVASGGHACSKHSARRTSMPSFMRTLKPSSSRCCATTRKRIP